MNKSHFHMKGFWRQHLEHLSSVDRVKFKIIKSVSKSSAAITKKGHCLEFVVTTVKRENSLEPFLPVYFEISFTVLKVKKQFLNVASENILVGSLWLETVDKGCRTFRTESGACFPCTARVFSLFTYKNDQNCGKTR